MYPVAYKGFPRLLQARALALRDFIFVMREFKVLPSEMEIKAVSQVMHAHGTAFYVPPRATLPPGAFPENLAISLSACLPQGKIGNGILGIFIGLNTLAWTHLIKVQFL